MKDTPLFQRVPEHKLQRLCLLCVTAMFITAATCASIVAIAVGSVLTPVAWVLHILAGASLLMVGVVFNVPRRRRKEQAAGLAG